MGSPLGATVSCRCRRSRVHSRIPQPDIVVNLRDVGKSDGVADKIGQGHTVDHASSKTR